MLLANCEQCREPPNNDIYKYGDSRVMAKYGVRKDSYITSLFSGYLSEIIRSFSLIGWT